MPSSRIATAQIGVVWRWCERSGGGGRPIGCSCAVTVSQELTRATGRARALKQQAACAQSEVDGLPSLGGTLFRAMALKEAAILAALV